MPRNQAGPDLQNPNQVFDAVWTKLEENYQPHEMCFPKEIMWLGGAPGSGKGTNTPFICRERDITAEPIVISSLLNTPEMEELKSKGKFIGDLEVVEILFEELLKPVYESGVVVDGFPRTKVQVDCVKLLYWKMLELSDRFFNTPYGPKFRNPKFRIAVLFVTEEVSIRRQLYRGKQIEEHNTQVKKTGEGQLLEARTTDLDEALAKKRYDSFVVQTFEALKSLRNIFHYHFIDANGSVEEVEKNIAADLSYQSSLELAEDTYDCIRDIPLSTTVTQHARQELVRRLDNYRHRHAELFAMVIRIISENIIPQVSRHAGVGKVSARLTAPELDKPKAIDMLVDVLVERGYYPNATLKEELVPVKIDPETYTVINATQKVWIIDVKFPIHAIRRGS